MVLISHFNKLWDLRIKVSNKGIKEGRKEGTVGEGRVENKVGYHTYFPQVQE